MTDLLLNSRKHGIDAAQLAIHPEEVFEFNQLLEGLYADMRPNGETQRLLTEELRLSQSEVSSIIRGATSQLHFTITRLLK